MKICKKRQCNNPGQVKHGISYYCFKHYRFYGMKSKAVSCKKYSPSIEELEGLIPQDLICPTCNKQMIWNNRLGQLKDLVTLQHCTNGTIMLMCYSCNSRHGRSALGDECFNIPKDYKYCIKCKGILHKNKFGKSSCYIDGLHNRCRSCINSDSKRRYHEKKRANMCTDCNARPSRQNRTRCIECTKRFKRGYKKERRRK